MDSDRSARLGSAQRIGSTLAKRLVHREDVLNGHAGLNIVNCVEDESARGGEDPYPLADLAPDLVRRAEWQGLLGVHAAPPERHPLPYRSLR